jgi:hypothetical protein|tara:strand:+ start:194 stop:1249 length:1056 start_codon:yes stop_codon:yes gene_type:complete
MLDRVEILLRDKTGFVLPVYFDVYDNSLSRKWLPAFNKILDSKLHLEKNYCFFGFPDSERDLDFLASEINRTIAGINGSKINYVIRDHFTVANMTTTHYSERAQADIIDINHEKFNQLHLYFEETQGVSGSMSKHYTKADAETRWYIRQLNLLCHEAECYIISLGRQNTTPEWIRPSNVMCWLNAPRFVLDDQDYNLFGVDTIARHKGGVYVGVNKAVGKHHYEVFCDEGGDSRIDELTTTTLKPQTEAAGDFDIEWGNNTHNQPFMQEKLREFRTWLTANSFDPDDPSLTIGHPKIGQVDLQESFGTEHFEDILVKITQHLDVYSIRTSKAYAEYDYTWRDSKELQVPLV